MSKPSILISNDDGIFASGIYALWQAMSEIGETIVVAPNTEKSAVGHAITISDPCLLYTSPSPRDQRGSRMPSSA